MMDQYQAAASVCSARRASTEEMRRGIGAPLAHHCHGKLRHERTGRPRRFGGVHRKMRHAHQRGLLLLRNRRPRNRRARCRKASGASWCVTPLEKAGAAACCATARTDITRLINTNRAHAAAPPCACRRLRGRSDDMLIIRGVNVFPSQIESVLHRHGGHWPALRDRRAPRGLSWITLEVTGGADGRKPAGKLRRAGGAADQAIRSSLRGRACRLTRRCTLVSPQHSQAL